MGSRSKMFGVCVLVTLLFVSTLPVEADGGGEDPEVIGSFKRLGMSSELTEERISTTSEGFKLDAPAFSSEMRVDRAYLDGRLPGWSSDAEFDLVGEEAVFDGEDVRFAPFVLDATPRFTMGSDDSVRFGERPMWVSVEDTEDGLKLEMDDGDTSGQVVRLAKQWLWEHGIHRPKVVHEDGSVLEATRSADGEYYEFTMPHFSWVILTPAEIDVRGRQSGNVAPHVGQIRWFGADTRLEIDIPVQLSAYELLVEEDWILLNIPNHALSGRDWVFETYQGVPFLRTRVQAADTPLTLSYAPFEIDGGWQFGAGDSQVLRMSRPELVLPSITSSGFDLSFAAPLAAHLWVTANATWMESIGIVRPTIGASNGGIDAFTVFNFSQFQFAAPLNATWVSVQESGDGADPTMGLMDEVLNVALGEKCQAVFGEVEPAEIDTWDVGGNEVGLYGLGTEFCLEWNLYDSVAESNSGWYNLYFALMEEDGEVRCGQGQHTAKSERAVTRQGTMTCSWPSSEDLPLRVDYAVGANAYWWEDSEASAESGLACAAGVLIATASAVAGFYFAPAWKGVLMGAGLCIDYAIEVGVDIYNGQGDLVGNEMIVGGGWFGESAARFYMRMEEPESSSAFRADTWTVGGIEYRLPRRDEWDGTQTICWTAENMEVPASITYDTEFSIVSDLSYLSSDVRLSYGSGGFSGVSKVKTFSEAGCGIRDSASIEIIGPSGDALDWEAPDPQCLFISHIMSVVNSEVVTLQIEDAYDLVCPGLVTLNIEAQGATNMSAPWLAFDVVTHDIDPSVNVAPNGSISLNDVLAEGGNITRAIARNLVDSEEFIDGIYQAGTGDSEPHTYCGSDPRYYWKAGGFVLTIAGTTLVGFEQVARSHSYPINICFDYLLGIPVVELQ